MSKKKPQRKPIRKAPTKRVSHAARAIERDVERRAANTMALVVHDPANRLPAVVAGDVAVPASGALTTTLQENAYVGNLGLYKLETTKEEVAILSREPDEAKIQIKPTGVPYLSHPTYTKWLNEAFGLGGWALVAAAMPKVANNVVMVPYVLRVRGVPVAFAWGEQEYHPNNREQTYGDAVEATNASALRRCAKRLGIGLELWDKQYLARWRAKYCVKVKARVWAWDRQANKSIEKVKEQWRRIDDPPFEKELGKAGDSGSGRADYVADGEYMESEEESRSAPPARRPAPPAAHDGSGDEPISDAQLRRLYTIASNAKRSHEQIKSWLAVAYSYGSSKEIKRKHYDEIVRAIESKDPLPLPAAREPGEDG